MFSVETLNKIRAYELACISCHFHPGARILEIGAGTGQQASDLAKMGFSVEAVEVADSQYSNSRNFKITEYDGRTLPFADRSFDFVFSSNVLEHVRDLSQLHREIARVLKPGGRAIHVMPTHWWRFWTTLSAFPAALQYILTADYFWELCPRWRLTRTQVFRAWRAVGKWLVWPIVQEAHGIRGNFISEIWYFRPDFWRKNFRANGFRIERDTPLGLFYTGNMVLNRRLTIASRARLAAYLGSACHVFVVLPATAMHSGNSKEAESDQPARGATV